MGPNKDYITHIDALTVRSHGGIKILEIYRKKFPKAHILEPLKSRNRLTLIFHLIKREIWYQKICPESNVLVFSALGPIFPSRSRIFIYFQNLTILEGNSLKNRILRNYLRTIKKFSNTTYVVQHKWILDNYNYLFEKDMSVVWDHNTINLDNNKNRIIKSIFCPTSLHKFKNIDKLFNCLLELNRTDLYLIITVSKQQFLKLYPGFIIPTNVVFTGDIESKFMKWFYENVDYTIITSDYETICLPIYESLNFGTKVIAPIKPYTGSLDKEEDVKLYSSWNNLKNILNEI